MDNEMVEQFQIVLQATEQSEARTNARIEQSEVQVKVFIENTVIKRIDSLFDDYKLTHENQWEMERRTEFLSQQLEDLQVRLTILENKSA